MSLWPHQTRAIAEREKAIAAGVKRIMLVSPTGGGKTRIATECIKASTCNVNWYTVRRMLYRQVGGVFDAAGIEYGIRAAGETRDTMARVQLCMTQTEYSACVVRKTRTVHPADEVWIDEAHQQANPSSLAVFDQHADAVQTWMTATPLNCDEARCEQLIIAGTNSELRKCGAHVPAYHYAPDEPDTKWVGQVKIGEGECGISEKKRDIYTQRIAGRVIEHWHTLNPDMRPTICFAPGVKQSLWLAQYLTRNGIPSAHIDGERCWVDGQLYASTNHIRDEIRDRLKVGGLRIVCNRFVLREGVDWPFIGHGIFATVFGSLTSYLQAGGRLIRAHPSIDRVTIQDHGGNWWRHGSLNADRHWTLGMTDRVVSGLRMDAIRERKEPEPICCPRCNAIRSAGPVCLQCGYQSSARTRPVLQTNGTLKPMTNSVFRERRYLEPGEQVERDWVARVRACRRSKRESVKAMTFNQLQTVFAKERGWQYPRGLPQMPIEPADWYLPVSQVPVERLTR